MAENRCLEMDSSLKKKKKPPVLGCCQASVHDHISPTYILQRFSTGCRIKSKYLNMAFHELVPAFFPQPHILFSFSLSQPCGITCISHLCHVLFHLCLCISITSAQSITSLTPLHLSVLLRPQGPPPESSSQDFFPPAPIQVDLIAPLSTSVD